MPKRSKRSRAAKKRFLMYVKDALKKARDQKARDKKARIISEGEEPQPSISYVDGTAHLTLSCPIVSTADESHMLKFSKMEQKMEYLMDDTESKTTGCSSDREGVPPPTNKYTQRLQIFLNEVETNTMQNESTSEPASSAHVSVGYSTSTASPEVAYSTEGKNDEEEEHTLEENGTGSKMTHTKNTEVEKVFVKMEEVIVKEEMFIQEKDTFEVYTPAEVYVQDDTHSTHSKSSRSAQNTENSKDHSTTGENGRLTDAGGNSAPGQGQTREVMEELKEMKRYMKEMSHSLRGIKTATSDIAASLKKIAGGACNGIRR